ALLLLGSTSLRQKSHTSNGGQDGQSTGISRDQGKAAGEEDDVSSSWAGYRTGAGLSGGGPQWPATPGTRRNQEAGEGARPEARSGRSSHGLPRSNRVSDYGRPVQVPTTGNRRGLWGLASRHGK